MPEYQVIYEDEDVLVIDKPAGVVVNNAESIQTETIQDWMQTRLPDRAQEGDWYSLLPGDFTEEYGSPQEIFKERGGIVHRLDRETSGALLLAKNPGALMHLMGQFKRRETRKEYTCLVHGAFQVTADTIRLPLMRAMRARGKFQVAANGRPAETEFEVLHSYRMSQEKLLERIKAAGLEKGQSDAQILKAYQSYQDFSLIKCHPKTGRTHQIRVHFAFLQHPLVADHLYTNKWRSKVDMLWCPRQFLHASVLTFQHPRTKEIVSVSVPLPQDLTAALAQVA